MNFNNASFYTAFGTSSQLCDSDRPEICFSGRSNVGKSSLINALLNRKALARTSTKPGKTITVNLYRVDKYNFVDLPGYGYAKVSFSERERWSDLMESYFDGSRDIRHVFQLIDMRHNPTKDDISMLEFLQSVGAEFTVVLTKSDKLNKTEREESLKGINESLSFLSDVDIVPFSAKTGEGIEYLRNKITDIFEG